MNVLVVDDDQGFARNFIEILKLGCPDYITDVTYIDNFMSAKTLTADEKSRYDLVISDTQLADLNTGVMHMGYDLLPDFIENGIPSVLMSGDDYSQHARDIGCRFHQKGDLTDQLNLVKEIFHQLN